MKPATLARMCDVLPAWREERQPTPAGTGHLSQAALQLALLHDARAGSMPPVVVVEQAQLQLALLQLALRASAAVLQLALLHDARV